MPHSLFAMSGGGSSSSHHCRFSSVSDELGSRCPACPVSALFVIVLSEGPCDLRLVSEASLGFRVSVFREDPPEVEGSPIEIVGTGALLDAGFSSSLTRACSRASCSSRSCVRVGPEPASVYSQSSARFRLLHWVQTGRKPSHF